MPMELDEKTFESAISQSDRPVLVDFWAPWCMPCRVVGPIVDALAEAYDGRVTVAKLNVDEAPAAAAKLGISAIPTLMLFRDGQKISTFVGVQPSEKIAAALDEALSVAT